MSGSFGMALMRRAGVVAVCALLAVVAALGPLPGSGAGVTRSALVGPQPTSPRKVMQALGVSNVPAEIVILVDVSLSMGPGYNDLYPNVRQKVLDYLGVLAQQDPQDLVGLVFFGGKDDTQVIDPGPPSRNTWLPEAPSSQETDFGWAFKQAYLMLQQARTSIKAGAVLLLSDGELSVGSEDTEYGPGFNAPGWKTLRQDVKALPMPVTGYDVPLTSNSTFTGNQYYALSQVFQPVQSLPVGVADLSSSLNMATQEILDSEVASAAAPDMNQGVRVAWSGLQGAGAKPLDLATGHAEVTLMVAATTRKVPLYLSGLSVTSTGLPVTMQGTLPDGYLLAPHQKPITLHVQLTWHPRRDGETMMGSPRTMRGTLVLGAAVSSPFTSPLQSAFGDIGFSVGGIKQGISPQFLVSEPVEYSILLLVLLLLLLLLVVAAVLVGACIAAVSRWLSGTLTVTAEGRDAEPVQLRGWWISRPTDKLVGKPGRMIVTGAPIRSRMRVRRRMRIRMLIDGRPPFDEKLLPGQDLLPAGIHVAHEPAHHARSDAADGAASGNSAPKANAADRSDNAAQGKE